MGRLAEAGDRHTKDRTGVSPLAATTKQTQRDSAKMTVSKITKTSKYKGLGGGVFPLPKGLEAILLCHMIEDFSIVECG